MKKLLPIGLSDYKILIDENYYYIDKTLLIDDILQYGSRVILLPRPRRFGKTLNMSMLKYFFEKTVESNTYLFEDKKIWQLPEHAALQGKFPVIFLTFKDVKQSTWQDTREKLVSAIVAEYTRHDYLLKSDILKENEKVIFEAIMARKAIDTDYHNSLKNLSEFLYRFYQVRPIVLIDEYDSPIHAGFMNDYYADVAEFIRGLMVGVFKDNSFLERGIITGILRTAKEGIFSGLNNLKIFTLLDDRINDKFGFTQQEIDQLLSDYDLAEHRQNLKDWYNGYLIGDGYLMGSVQVYNPWSVLNCVDNNGRLKPYWVNTSDNALIHKIVVQVAPIFKQSCADLMLGNIVKNIEIKDDTALPLLYLGHDISSEQKDEIDIKEHVDSIWSLLLFSGYVTPHAYHIIRHKTYVDLKLPNEELHELFAQLVKKLFRKNVESINVTALYEALKHANGTKFSEILTIYLVQSTSYHDIDANEPENSYHLFVLGLLVVLSEKYQVLSNRESGEGRFDIMLTPFDHAVPGIVIEFKKLDGNETMAECAERALEQIKERQYAVQLKQQGIKRIVAFGIAVHKKAVLLHQEEL